MRTSTHPINAVPDAKTMSYLKVLASIHLLALQSRHLIRYRGLLFLPSILRLVSFAIIFSTIYTFAVRLYGQVPVPEFFVSISRQVWLQVVRSVLQGGCVAKSARDFKRQRCERDRLGYFLQAVRVWVINTVLFKSSMGTYPLLVPLTNLMYISSPTSIPTRFHFSFFVSEQVHSFLQKLLVLLFSRA